MSTLVYTGHRVIEYLFYFILFLLRHYLSKHVYRVTKESDVRIFVLPTYFLMCVQIRETRYNDLTGGLTIKLNMNVVTHDDVGKNQVIRGLTRSQPTVLDRIQNFILFFLEITKVEFHNYELSIRYKLP